MISLLLKLLVAHTIGDFVFQPDKWVEDKKQRKHKSKYLYFHLLVHAFALILALQFNFKYWLAILLIVASHFIIDLMKLKFDNKINARQLFALDQAAHILVILGVVYIYEPFQINISLVYSTNNLILILALIAITSIASIIMKLIMSKWVLDEDDANDSLEKAGKYIGILERLFVFGFIIMSQWQAIGLLIAAKSVFRFGDLSKAKDRKLTEYILIGTLLSFGLAMSIGLAYNYAIELWGS
tara:strand:- start:24535 stop:25257 length:723 start_codon:yes stop_codon:yes gene_type:complete